MNKVFSLSFVLFFFLLVFLGFSNVVYAQQYSKEAILEIKFHYNDKKISLISIDRKQGYVPDYKLQSQKGYTLQIVDIDQRDLFKVIFDFPLERIDEGLDLEATTTSVVTLREIDYVVTVPSFENAKELRLLNSEGKFVLQQELSAIVDPDITNRGATKQSPFGFVSIKPIYGLLAGIGVLLPLVVLVYFVKKKKQGVGDVSSVQPLEPTQYPPPPSA